MGVNLPVSTINAGKFNPVALYLQSGSSFIPATPDMFGGSGGSANVTVNNTAPIPVSGFVSQQTGTYQFFFTGISGNNTNFTIPLGSRTFAIGCSSGLATINGTLIGNGTSVRGGGNGNLGLGNSVIINTLTGSFVMISYEF